MDFCQHIMYKKKERIILQISTSLFRILPLKYFPAEQREMEYENIPVLCSVPWKRYELDPHLGKQYLNNMKHENLISLHIYFFLSHFSSNFNKSPQLFKNHNSPTYRSNKHRPQHVTRIYVYNINDIYMLKYIQSQLAYF